ncbi:MAG: DedA family protein [Saprospiraceae bacterium]|nr:DedA family protein [Saprospiraceae bacterium]
MTISLLSLLFWSFLAATILPFGVEPYFVYHILTYDQPLLTIFVASLGNITGSSTILWLGIKGSKKMYQHFNSSNKKTLDIASAYFTKYGLVSLLFSWVPFIGDLLVLLASFSNPPVLKSLILISIGKIARFVFLAWTISL